MDNTLKLIIAVLSMSGLLVMMVPDSKPTVDAKPVEAPVQVVPPPPSADPSTEDTGEVIETDENGNPIDNSDDGEFIKFGQPMMDGKPIDPLSGDDYGRSSDPSVNVANPATNPSTDAGTAPVVINGPTLPQVQVPQITTNFTTPSTGQQATQ